MELWIRSQDRQRLVKANGLLISNIGEVYLENEEMILLGEYTPYERALEVLDEIQSLIDFMINREMNRYDAEEYMQICYEELEKIKENGLIYQMPKE